jgi:hypothetical protein
MWISRRFLHRLVPVVAALLCPAVAWSGRNDRTEPETKSSRSVPSSESLRQAMQERRKKIEHEREATQAMMARFNAARTGEEQAAILDVWRNQQMAKEKERSREVLSASPADTVASLVRMKERVVARQQKAGENASRTSSIQIQVLDERIRMADTFAGLSEPLKQGGEAQIAALEALRAAQQESSARLSAIHAARSAEAGDGIATFLSRDTSGMPPEVRSAIERRRKKLLDAEKLKSDLKTATPEEQGAILNKWRDDQMREEVEKENR